MADAITLDSDLKSYPTIFGTSYRNIDLWSACPLSKKGITNVIIIVNTIPASARMMPQNSTLIPRNDNTSVELLTTVQA